MKGYKRQRSTSAVEEKNVSSYVQSCVDFHSNVSFSLVGASPADAEMKKSPILLLGIGKNLEDPKQCTAMVPFLTAPMVECIKRASVGKCEVAYKDADHLILSGKISSEASRHNCSTRPDQINEIIKSALSDTPQGTTLHVFYVGQDLPLSVSVAISRASSYSFTAEKGAAQKGYTAAKKVKVFLQSGNVHVIDATCTAVKLAQRLVNAPTNLLDTTTFAEIAVSYVEKLQKQGKNVSYSILQGEELREQGYGGLYGVGKAAEYPPHLITLSYKPKGEISPKDKIALVGKGIVYDTGGLAIKSREGMRGMKRDMGGAAAVFGGFVALAMIDAPVEVSCILCLADNAIGPRSQRQDDIVLLKSGLSVEITNTDAEGRLVLSDGVYHASSCLSYVPNTVVDMATLTGAQGIATGKFHAAIYTNAENAEAQFVEAGKRSGELCFPVVYCPEFHKREFSSKMADCTNSVAGRSNAQVSCAGHFIEKSLAGGFKGSWVHVDLASPAARDEGTGFGVALLVQAFASQLVQ